MKKTTTLFLLLFIYHFSQSQTFDWAKSIGNNVSDGHSIITDANNNVYTLGNFKGTADFDPSSNSSFMLNHPGANSIESIYLSKLDVSGNFVWAKSFAGIENQRLGSFTLDANGNIYITGNFKGTTDFDPNSGVYNLTATNPGNPDIFICKLDNSGNFKWVKQFTGNNVKYCDAIKTDNLGNIYIAGSFQLTCDFDPGVGVYNLTGHNINRLEGFICKLDNNGDFKWAKQFGNSGDVEFNSMALDNNGNIYTIGSFTYTVDFDPGSAVYNLKDGGFTDAFISKLDNNGNFVWAKQLYGNLYGYGLSIVLDNNKNIYATAVSYGTTDYDPGAGIYNLTSSGLHDFFIFKLDSIGNFSWAKQIGGSDNDYAYSIALDNSNNIYVTGSFGFTVDFDPGTPIFNLSSGSNTYVKKTFILKLNSVGNFIWAGQVTNPNNNDYGASITLDANENIIVTGSYSGTSDFDAGNGTYNLTSFYPATFILKLKQLNTNISEDKTTKKYLTYPNPSNGFITIVSNAENITSLQLKDVMGKQVIKTVYKLYTGDNQIDLSHLNKGVYLMEFLNENNYSYERLIIE